MSGHDTEGIRPEPLTPKVITNSESESIAQSLLPWNFDDARARYISLRCCGLTIREVLKYMQYAHSSLSHWREDEQFLKIEADIPNLRRQLSLEYSNVQFLRNFTLIMEKDYRVIKKSLDHDADLTKQEQEYLIKARSHYSPQQLQIVETLINAEKKDASFNFTEFVLETRKLEERVRVTKTTITNLPKTQIEQGEVDGEDS